MEWFSVICLKGQLHTSRSAVCDYARKWRQDEILYLWPDWIRSSMKTLLLCICSSKNTLQNASLNCDICIVLPHLKCLCFFSLGRDEEKIRLNTIQRWFWTTSQLVWATASADCLLLSSHKTRSFWVGRLPPSTTRETSSFSDSTGELKPNYMSDLWHFNHFCRGLPI